MTVSTGRPNWTARLAWGVLLILVGAAASVWALSKWEGGARFFGVAPTPVVALAAPRPVVVAPPAPAPLPPADATRLASLEARLGQVEQASRQAAGSAGRADALLIAFAARRAIDRGVPLGYLEPLLIERFGQGQEAAVATVVTSSRTPETLDRLIGDFQMLGPTLRGPGVNESWWTGFRREMGGLVTVHRADRPSARPDARYDRALEALRAGKVGAALTEAVRLPGADRPEAKAWIDRAKRQVAVANALDSLESAALIGGGRRDAPQGL